MNSAWDPLESTEMRFSMKKRCKNTEHRYVGMYPNAYLIEFFFFFFLAKDFSIRLSNNYICNQQVLVQKRRHCILVKILA